MLAVDEVGGNTLGAVAQKTEDVRDRPVAVERHGVARGLIEELPIRDIGFCGLVAAGDIAHPAAIDDGRQALVAAPGLIQQPLPDPVTAPCRFVIHWRHIWHDERRGKHLDRTRETIEHIE